VCDGRVLWRPQGAWFIATGQALSLSEQQLVDW
jgi:hypothetical protein